MPSIFNVWRTLLSYKQEGKYSAKKKKEWNQQTLWIWKLDLWPCFGAHGALQSMQMLSAPVGWTVMGEARGGGFHKWPQSLFLTEQSESHLDLNSHSRQSTLCNSPLPRSVACCYGNVSLNSRFGCFYVACVMSTTWNIVHTHGTLEKSSKCQGCEANVIHDTD